jgi:sporulation protein YtfJ
MNEHPIEGLMATAMSSIQNMIDVNTIVGEPIETYNNVVIIPISKVSFGFAAGGSEFTGETIEEYSKKDREENVQCRLPFGGGSRSRRYNKSSFIFSSSRKYRKTFTSGAYFTF